MDDRGLTSSIGLATVHWAVWTMCFGFGWSIPLLMCDTSLTIGHVFNWLAGAAIVYPVVIIVYALRAKK